LLLTLFQRTIPKNMVPVLVPGFGWKREIFGWRIYKKYSSTNKSILLWTLMRLC